MEMVSGGKSDSIYAGIMSAGVAVSDFCHQLQVFDLSA
jgi:hypothetical protein